MEIAIESEDMRVPEMGLDLDLAPDLLLDLVLDDLGFVQTFEGEDILRWGAGADHVDTAEFAFSEGLADFEVGEMPFSSRS
jgi:hypothetical protein